MDLKQSRKILLLLLWTVFAATFIWLETDISFFTYVLYSSCGQGHLITKRGFLLLICMKESPTSKQIYLFVSRLTLSLGDLGPFHVQKTWYEATLCLHLWARLGFHLLQRLGHTANIRDYNCTEAH